jgi:ferritin-like metal-binding protein YciE
MALTRIRELYVAELSETYESEQEILRQLPLMAARACDPALRQLFEDHYRETRGHVDRLNTLFEQLDERRRPTPAPAMRGLAEEARIRQASLDRGELLDLALIDSCRRIEHYEIAAYSAAIGYARRLGHHDAAALLLQTLEEERRADNQLETLPASTRLTAA